MSADATAAGLVVPVVSRQDLAEDLKRLYESPREHHLFAYYGTGSEDAVDLPNAARVTVVPVRSELELRMKLPLLDDDARVAFLVPFKGEVPLDLQARFALNGRVRRIRADARLRRIFGVKDLDDEVHGSALAQYLLDQGAPTMAVRENVSRLTPAGMWDAYFQHTWRVTWAGDPTAAAALGWAVRDGHGPAFAKAMAEGLGAAAREEWLGYLEVRLPALGRTLWETWERGEAEKLLTYGMVLEPFAETFAAAADEADAGGSGGNGTNSATLTKPEVTWTRMTLKAEFGVEDPASAFRLAARLARATDGALRYASTRDSERDTAWLRTLLAAADAIAADPALAHGVSQSRRLPRAWAKRLDTLGAALESAAKSASAAQKRGPDASRSGLEAADVEAVHRALRGLEEHHAYLHAKGVVQRAEMAARLVAWLAARPELERLGGLTPSSDAEALARWYADEGGYVDRARRYARGPAVDALGRGAQAVVAVADGAREELDRRFAEGLAAWLEAGKRSTQLVPIESALDSVAVPFLQANEEHRLLVLLMDGMAWAQAVELLESLGEQGSAWGPLAWHRLKSGRLGEGFYPSVIASQPTLTNVSRAAFFAGKPIDDGKLPPTDLDVRRFRDHKGIGKFFEGADTPTLLLRSDGHTPGGSASEAALNLVADPNARVVGIVINAIDSSLKGDAQQVQRWDVKAFRSLEDLLTKARDARRSILLASDHGHVPSDRLTSMPRSTDGGARWRQWGGPSDELAEGEILLRGKHVWTPKGAEGVVLLTDDAKRYGGSATAGEHGGATLAEVVAPCVLIGASVNADEAEGPDAATRVMGAHAPSWWLFDVRDKVRPSSVPPPPVDKSKKKRGAKAPEGQLSLVGVVPPEPPPPAAAQTAPADDALRAVRALGQSEEFRARAKGEDEAKLLRAVDFLIAQNGAARAAAFASALGELPFRVGGVVSRMQGVLNVDGYAVLRFDRQNDQVYLDRNKLNELFEVNV